MRKILIAASLALAVASISGCTDAERASMFALGDPAEVKCYSGGQVIHEDISTGKVQPIDGDGFTYKSQKSGKLVRAFADCILTTVK